MPAMPYTDPKGALGFSAGGYAAWNAWITASIIVIAAMAAVRQTYDWEEWVSLIAGLWAFISPWLMGFSGEASAAWPHFMVGVGVAALAGIELRRLFSSPEARRV